MLEIPALGLKPGKQHVCKLPKQSGIPESIRYPGPLAIPSLAHENYAINSTFGLILPLNRDTDRAQLHAYISPADHSRTQKRLRKGHFRALHSGSYASCCRISSGSNPCDSSLDLDGSKIWSSEPVTSCPFFLSAIARLCIAAPPMAMKWIFIKRLFTNLFENASEIGSRTSSYEHEIVRNVIAFGCRFSRSRILHLRTDY